MSQQKRGQQSHGAEQNQSRSNQDPSRSTPEQMHGDRLQQDREPAEGSRENVNLDRDIDADREKKRRDERGMGGSGERNSGGISNRGMDRSTEQQDLPQRGSTRESER